MSGEGEKGKAEADQYDHTSQRTTDDGAKPSI